MNRREVLGVLGATLALPALVGLSAGCSRRAGARAVEVPRFIDLLLAEWFPDEERARFLAGLADVDARARAAFGADFTAGSDAQRAALLTQLDAEVQALREAKQDVGRHFFQRMKWLTLYGYYASQAGAEGELHYETIPGAYRKPAGSERRRGARQLRRRAHPDQAAGRSARRDALPRTLEQQGGPPGLPGDHTAFGVAVVRAVGSARVKLLFDIYHMQIMEGDIIRTIRDAHEHIGHFHTGGVPGRHELDDAQELNYRGIAAAIAATGFAGYVAHEFVPTRDPLRSLREAVATCTV